MVDPNSKTRITVDPNTQSVVTEPDPLAPESRFRMPSRACTSSSNVEKSSILGYTVLRVQEDFLFPGRQDLQSHFDRWVATELDCLILRETVIDVRSKAHNEQEAIFITEGEPAAGLFEIPSSYIQRSSSEWATEYLRRFPGPPGRVTITTRVLRLIPK
jgi:hypothetical protein